MRALPALSLGWFSPGSPARSSQFDVDLIDAWDAISNTVPTARWLPPLPDEWKVHGTLLHHTDVVIDDQHKQADHVGDARRLLGDCARALLEPYASALVLAADAP